MDLDREMELALHADGEKLRQITGEDHGPFTGGYAPCPHCFESSGYVWEHGHDWESGPWSHQTNTPCPACHGTGLVDADIRTLDDLETEVMP